MEQDKIKAHCLSKPKACEDHPFGEWPICYKVHGKIFAQLYPDKITLKCTAFQGQMFRQAFPDIVVRGYHCPRVQQPYWNTIDLNRFPNEELHHMIDIAYEAVVTGFSKKVQQQILKPEGIIGTAVTVTVDRPLGSLHPKHQDLYYPVNYGYIAGIPAPDGMDQDAYILGVDNPVDTFTGTVIAIIHRYDDVETKWVVAPQGMHFSPKEIETLVQFQEHYFHSVVIV